VNGRARVSPYLTGGDPAPGDPAQVRRVICQLRQAVEAVQDALDVLRAVGVDVGLWTGPAADAFAAKRGDLQARLATADTAYTDAANALDRWARGLDDAQCEAAWIVAQAEAIMRQQPPDPNAAFNPFPTVPAPVLGLQRQHDRLAQRARADAQRCACELDAAAALVGRYERSLWEQVSGLLADASELLHAVTPWLSLAALFIPALGPVVLGLDVLTLAIDVVLLADGKQTWGDVAWDAVGVGLGVVGGAGETMSSSARAATRFDAAGFTVAAKHVSVRTSFGGAMRHEMQALRHPIEALRDEQAIATALKQADYYNKLPALKVWTTNLKPVVIGTSLHALDIGADAWEAGKQLRTWVGSQLAADQQPVCR
jgi:hypothetical protein